MCENGEFERAVVEAPVPGVPGMAGNTVAAVLIVKPLVGGLDEEPGFELRLPDTEADNEGSDPAEADEEPRGT